MPRLLQHTCFNHAAREAVARCPECRRFYCRECVTEHDDRVICAACLKRLAQSPRQTRRWIGRVREALQCLAGGLLLWFVFYLMGSLLISIPDEFHQGTLWKADWIEQ